MTTLKYLPEHKSPKELCCLFFRFTLITVFIGNFRYRKQFLSEKRIHFFYCSTNIREPDKIKDTTNLLCLKKIII